MEIAINAQLVSFGQSYRNAGISRYTKTLLESLTHNCADALTPAESAQHYTVFINAAETELATKSSFAQAPVVQLRSSPRRVKTPLQRIAWEQFTLPAELRRVQAEVFHAPMNVLPARVPCASVVTVHDLAFVRYPQFYRPSRRLYQRILTAQSARRATLVAAVSESTKRDLITYMGVPAERIHVIYTALGDAFRPVRDPQVLAAFRAAHDLPERYLLYLGTLEPRKNLERLVEAYARLHALRTETPPLIIAGATGWYYQPLFRQVQQLALERSITFVGYVSREEQALWYSGATAFIYPSLYEGFGLPVMEALACGTPTITSNVSSLPEAAGPVAWQVSPTETDALAMAMHNLLDDESTRARMEAEGPQWAARFTAEQMAHAYAQLYEAAAGLRRDKGTKRKG